MWLKGEDVIVRTYEETGRDPYGASIKKPKEETIENVLVAPGPREDLGEDRPEGVMVRYTLYFPKTFSGSSLEGAEICVRGEWLAAIGHPDRFSPCPTSWDMVCEVGGSHG